jgi:hypothetical protein
MTGAMSLTQNEADALIAMAKTFADTAAISIPPGADDSRGLIGANPNERFLLDIWRSTFRLSKLRYQTRGRQIIVLVRLDIDGAPHTNPDGERLTGTHLHVYREGYDDKWAQPVDARLFPDPADVQRCLVDFCAYCNIQSLPPFQGGFV